MIWIAPMAEASPPPLSYDSQIACEPRLFFSACISGVDCMDREDAERIGFRLIKPARLDRSLRLSKRIDRSTSSFVAPPLHESA